MLFSYILYLFLGMTTTGEILLTDFDKKDLNDWIIVNDGVMGGISTSQIQHLPESQAVFSGSVSMENNGGFVSTRMKIDSGKLAGCTTISLRLKGDGKKYKFRIRTDDKWDGITYSADFLTIKDEWMEIELLLENFKPTYRGRILNQGSPLKAADIRQVGLLISDKQSGSFSIILDWIKCR